MVGVIDGTVKLVSGNMSDATWAAANDPRDRALLGGDW